MENSAGEVDGFRKAWVHRKLALASGKSAGAQSKAKASPTVFENEAGSSIARQRWPCGSIDIALASSLCPAPVRIYADSANGRWQVYFPGMASRSRSWAAHGLSEACRQVLEWAWAEVLALQGLPKSECPITDLFRSSATSADVSGGPVGASSASSGAASSGVVRPASATTAPPEKRRKR